MFRTAFYPYLKNVIYNTSGLTTCEQAGIYVSRYNRNIHCGKYTAQGVFYLQYSAVLEIKHA